MINPEINVQVDASMPLGELLEQNKDPNISIKRSAHIGNMFGADLILASLGMNMLLVDANYGERDKLYFPHLIVDESCDAIEIACPRTLSLANVTNGGDALNDTAIASLATTFGNIKVESDSMFVGSNKVLVERIVAILIPEYTDEFKREMCDRGMPRPLSVAPTSVDDILLLGAEPSKGALIPNNINILIDFVVEALLYGTNKITHISGPTMAKYIMSMLPQMNEMYAELVSAGLPLPEVLNVRLVPAAGVRFVVAAAQAEDLDELIELQRELEARTSEAVSRRKEMIITNPKASKEDFDIINKPQKAVLTELKRKSGQIPQLFYVANQTSNNPIFTSQYSALRNGANGKPGSGLYIPSMVLERPISEITVEFEQLEKMRNQK